MNDTIVTDASAFTMTPKDALMNLLQDTTIQSITLKDGTVVNRMNAGALLMQFAADAATDSLDHLAAFCFNESERAGWWKEPDGSDSLENRYCLSNKISLIHTEVAEMTEADRKGADTYMDPKVPEHLNITVEAADAIIRILDLCGAKRWQLGAAFRAKMAYNRSRLDHKMENRVREGGKKY